MKKTLNFDLFMQERNNDTIAVTVLDKEYVIPAAIPAIVPVMMARAESTDDSMLATKMVMRAADAMFGKDVVNELCDKGLSAANLANLVQKLFEQINGADDDDESEELSDENSRRTVTGRKPKK